MDCILLLALLLAPAETLQGKVVSIHDGDGTIRVLDADNVQHLVRLAGMKQGSQW